ncbi:MAG: helix-turn-helix transcriptional regulator [Pseudomonadota bacterium]
MRQTKQLVDALKKAIKAKGLTYADISRRLGLSEASVKRVFSQRSFTLERFEEICTLADVTVYDLARMTRLSEEDGVTRLSASQEQALAKDQILLSYFYLLTNNWSPGRISKRYRFDVPTHTSLLVKLDRLGLIELLPNNRVRLLTERNIQWRAKGPVRNLYEKLVKDEFLRCEFAGDNQKLNFATGELSAASIQILMKKLDRLHQEFNELAELDLATPPGKKLGVGLMLAQRPWTFWSVLEKVRPTKG